MSLYQLHVFGGGCPYTKTYQARSLEEALQIAKRSEIQSDAEWSLHPVWQGEVRVDSGFKVEGKRYRVFITKQKGE